MSHSFTYETGEHFTNVSVYIYDIEHVKVTLQGLQQLVKDTINAQPESYAPLVFEFKILDNKEEDDETMWTGEFFLKIVQQYPSLHPLVHQYVKSIQTPILQDNCLVGFSAITALAVFDKNYLEEFEQFRKWCIAHPQNVLGNEKYHFTEEIEEPILETLDTMLYEINKYTWDENVMEFMTTCMVKSEFVDWIAGAFPKEAKADFFDAFLKLLLEKTPNSDQYLTENPPDDFYEKYELDELFERVFRKKKMDTLEWYGLESDLEERFKKCLAKGKIPTYEYLLTQFPDDEDLDPSDFDNPDDVVEAMQHLADKAMEYKMHIGAFAEFVGACDLNHPSSGWEEAEIMWEVISHWEWCPETVELAAVCMMTPAQWGPSECVPFSKDMPPDMFDLLIKEVCDDAFHLNLSQPKVYDENFEIPERSSIRYNFRFKNIMELVLGVFEGKDEEVLAHQLHKALAQECYPTYQFFETGKMG